MDVFIFFSPCEENDLSWAGGKGTGEKGEREGEKTEGGRENSSLVKRFLANTKPCEGCLYACYF